METNEKNTIGAVFIYKEFNLTVTIDPNNVHIEDSYQVKKKDDMLAIIEQIREIAAEQDITYKRSIKSWLNEWRAHNQLYLNGTKPERTRSVDLNEDESLLRRIIYWFLSNSYKEGVEEKVEETEEVKEGKIQHAKRPQDDDGETTAQ